MPNVNAKSSDGIVVPFTEAEVNFVPFLKDIVDGGADGEEVDVPAVNGVTLLQVQTFVAHRSTNAFPTVDSPLDNRGDLTKTFPAGEWLHTFITTKPVKQWFDLLKAGDFLRVEDLMNLASIAIATKYLAYSVEARDLVFGGNDAPADLNDPSIMALREEHKWAEEEPELFEKLFKAGVLPSPTGVLPAAAGGGAAS